MQNSYSQNGEDLIMLEYWNERWAYHNPTVVEFGANNGSDLSNSKLLIEAGFNGLLIEPSNQFQKLKALHKNDPDVTCLNVAISDKCGKMDFYESGAHVPGGKDEALVSTLDINELKRWPNVAFKKREVDVVDIKTLRAVYFHDWGVISIDIEGQDWKVLQQIDLKAVGCKLLCIEWNSIQVTGRMFTNYCAKYGMNEIHRNAENLIFAR